MDGAGALSRRSAQVEDRSGELSSPRTSSCREMQEAEVEPGPAIATNRNASCSPTLRDSASAKRAERGLEGAHCLKHSDSNDMILDLSELHHSAPTSSMTTAKEQSRRFASL